MPLLWDSGFLRNVWERSQGKYFKGVATRFLQKTHPDPGMDDLPSNKRSYFLRENILDKDIFICY